MVSTPPSTAPLGKLKATQTRPPSRPLGRDTRLSICEDGGVVALKAAVDQLLGAGRVDGFLMRVHVEQVVVGEGLVLAQDHLGLAWHHVGADVASLDLLLRQLRTDPAQGRERSLYSFLHTFINLLSGLFTFDKNLPVICFLSMKNAD